MLRAIHGRANGPHVAGDAGGRLVLPAFQDAHVHLADGGTDLISPDAMSRLPDVDIKKLTAQFSSTNIF